MGRRMFGPARGVVWVGAAVVVALGVVSVAAADGAASRTTYRLELVDPVAPKAPARAYEVVQTTNGDGDPIRYTLTFVAQVCDDGQCKPVDVTIAWDGLGFFEELTYPPTKPLTKTKREMAPR